MERGFVLTPTYRVIGGRPEVHLHAVLESGEPALVIDDREAPYFFVPAGAGERGPPLVPVRQDHRDRPPHILRRARGPGRGRRSR